MNETIKIPKWKGLHQLYEALDIIEFARSCGIDPWPWQADFLLSTHPRIIMNCPRGAGKSSLTAILALHHALHTPNAFVLLFSRSERQSMELFKKVIDFYKKRKETNKLPNASNASNAESAHRIEFKNGSRIISLPSSIETVVGYHNVTLLVIDEAALVRNELYIRARPMLDHQRGRLLVLSTPFGMRGFFFEEWQDWEKNPRTIWHGITVTTNDCPHMTPAFLSEERQKLGERAYRQEYECSFEENEESLFRYELIQRAIRDDIEELDLDLSDKRKTSKKTETFIDELNLDM